MIDSNRPDAAELAIDELIAADICPMHCCDIAICDDDDDDECAFLR